MAAQKSTTMSAIVRRALRKYTDVYGMVENADKGTAS